MVQVDVRNLKKSSRSGNIHMQVQRQLKGEVADLMLVQPRYPDPFGTALVPRDRRMATLKSKKKKKFWWEQCGEVQAGHSDSCTGQTSSSSGEGQSLTNPGVVEFSTALVAEIVPL